MPVQVHFVTRISACVPNPFLRFQDKQAERRDQYTRQYIRLQGSFRQGVAGTPHAEIVSGKGRQLRTRGTCIVVRVHGMCN